MKKVLYGVMSLAIAASVLSLNSCDDKIVSSEDKIDTSKTATLIINTGVILESGKDAVPMSGQATLMLIAANNTLEGSGSGNYIQYESLSGAQMTVQVPVQGKGTDYKLVMPEFVAQYNDGSNTENYSFKGGEETGTKLEGLMPGDVKVLKIKYQIGTKVQVK